GNVVGADAVPVEIGAIEIGTPVRCVFTEVPDPDTGETLTLPQWELR
ncbi:MAG: hypothetical protein QOJ23_2774, partial [Actinomycetota bacterium]|nr:hypothetical protein [Actinomycetota bacterium]